MPIDYDSPWKEALDVYFEQFLRLLFPWLHSQIDWSRGYEVLDKEFQQIVREAEVGRRYVDKLVKVWTLAGDECWVLIHVEVQTDRDTNFSQRMYIYRYRIFDRYNRPVASLAILADDDSNWRPTEYREELFRSQVSFGFPIAKILDWANRESELEASNNPFAKVVLAHLKARETKDDPANRHHWKLRLVRGLYERGFSPKDVRELFRVIDWLMELPPPIDRQFLQDVDDIQKEKQMPYVTSIERFGRAKGLHRGIETALRMRFSAEGTKLIPNVQQIFDESRLEAILDSLETAGNLEAVRQLCQVDSPTH